MLWGTSNTPGIVQDRSSRFMICHGFRMLNNESWQGTRCIVQFLVPYGALCWCAPRSCSRDTSCTLVQQKA